MSKRLYPSGASKRKKIAEEKQQMNKLPKLTNFFSTVREPQGEIASTSKDTKTSIIDAGVSRDESVSTEKPASPTILHDSLDGIVI